MKKFSVQELTSEMEKLSIKDSLKGIAFDQTTNNDLAGSYFVDIPGKDYHTSSALGEAMVQAMKQSKNRPLFIDIAQLYQSSSNNFFTSKIDQSGATISSKLEELINSTSLPVVIRYMLGYQGTEAVKPTESPILKELNRIAKDASNKSVKVQYGCSYRADFNKSKLSNGNLSLSTSSKTFLNSLAASNNISESETWWHQFIEALPKIAGAIWDLISNPTEFKFGWNHAKIFAINGNQMVQGCNFWDNYNMPKKDTIDAATHFSGGATHSAHIFCDYLWKGVSFEKQTWEVYENGVLLENQPIMPMMYQASGLEPTGEDTVLVTNTIGFMQTRLGEMGFLYYPLMDILSNWAYAWLKGKGLNQYIGWVVSAITAADTFMHFLPDSISEYFPDGITPQQFYAGRYAKRLAISNAQSSICLSQQKLVMDDCAAVNELAKYIFNEKWDITNWDHNIWPFDLMIALANASKRGGIKIHIVCSKVVSGNCVDDFNQTISKSDFQNMLTALGGSTFRTSYQEAYFEQQQISNHSKIMYIDNNLMYVGSENFYPSYNQEFGLWFDRPHGLFYSGFDFENYWNNLWAAASNKNYNPQDVINNLPFGPEN